MMAKTPAQLDREIAEALAGKTSQRTRSTIAGARVAKTKLIHVVQGNYGYGHGWEDLTAENTRKEALVRLREYRANEAGPFRLIRRRERIEGAATPAATPAHARKKKIDHHEAKRRLQAAGIDFSRDSDELRMSEAQLVADTAREAGYRKRKDAPGSTSRMYFQYLRRLRNHATQKKHTIYDLVEVNTRAKKERVLHQHFSTKSDAKEAQDEYKELKKPDLTYQIRSRQIAAPAYRWNPED
jgi:hypothetical protein